MTTTKSTHTPGAREVGHGACGHGLLCTRTGCHSFPKTKKVSVRVKPPRPEHYKLIVDAAPEMMTLIQDALLASGFGIEAPMTDEQRYSAPAWITKARALLARIEGQ